MIAKLCVNSLPKSGFISFLVLLSISVFGIVSGPAVGAVRKSVLRNCGNAIWRSAIRCVFSMCLVLSLDLSSDLFWPLLTDVL